MFTNLLQLREVFHLTFLRALNRSLPESGFVLKGGSNLRFFFGSDRYSQDMDLDVVGVPLHVLCEKVMAILASGSFAATLRTFGVERIRPPDLSVAKQTPTVQRFKVHLLTGAGEDVATKVEFSRRGVDAPHLAEPVLPQLLAAYCMAPLIVRHYTAHAAACQKIKALVSRQRPEARDVFDLYVLSSRSDVLSAEISGGLSARELREAHDRTCAMDYERYRDTVVGFLGPEDQKLYDSKEMWDQIRLVVLSLIEGGLADEK